MTRCDSSKRGKEKESKKHAGDERRVGERPNIALPTECRVALRFVEARKSRGHGRKCTSSVCLTYPGAADRGRKRRCGRWQWWRGKIVLKSSGSSSRRSAYDVCVLSSPVVDLVRCKPTQSTLTDSRAPRGRIGDTKKAQWPTARRAPPVSRLRSAARGSTRRAPSSPLWENEDASAHLPSFRSRRRRDAVLLCARRHYERRRDCKIIKMYAFARHDDWFVTVCVRSRKPALSLSRAKPPHSTSRDGWKPTD